MKILKYILYVILGLIVAFFALGLLKSSISYGHEITVNKPVEEAWAVSKDQSKFDQWLDGFQSIELISGEQDQVGSKYKVIVNPGEGQSDFEMTETLASMKEFEEINLKFDSEMMDFDQTMTYTAADGKTTIKTDSKVMPKGIFMRSMFAWMDLLGDSFTKQEAKNMEALKKLIESNTTNYYPSPEPIMAADSVQVVE
jgi:uncharacterized membrane protein